VKAARFSIDTGEMIDGGLPLASVATVTNWCRRHRDACAPIGSARSATCTPPGATISRRWSLLSPPKWLL
jgi:hypothetical protein